MSYTKSILLVIPIVLLSSCPSKIGDLIPSTRKYISAEVTAYQRFDETHEKIGEEPAINLHKWADALDNVAYNLKQINYYFLKNPDDRSKVEGNMATLKDKLDNILDRSITYNLRVPSWQVSAANDAVEDIYLKLEYIRYEYRMLYTSTLEKQTYVIKIYEDTTILDAHPLCVDKIGIASLGDSERSTCVHEAAVYCSHKMNLQCVDTIVMIGIMERIQGSMCAKVWYDEVVIPGIDEPRTIKRTSPRTWLSGIEKCKTQSVNLK
jgi:hypothetical protein